MLRNISEGGLYFEGSKRHPLRSNRTFTFFIPPSSIPVRVSGEVVRHLSLGPNRHGCGVTFQNLSQEAGRQIQQFIQRQAERPVPGGLKVFYHTITIETKQQNLSALDPRLAQFLRPTDYFYIHDFTEDLKAFVKRGRISDGTLTAQILHTSATLLVNELNEPMLLMDLLKKIRDLVPKDADYFHNGPMREVNFCAGDSHCDQNGDAHVRSALFGHPSITLLVKGGQLILGEWQRVALIEFDGPRHREVIAQLIGMA